MPGYSGFSLLGNALLGHRHWPRAWRDAEPKKRYDVVVIGAGGHGLATAYYLEIGEKTSRCWKRAG
jgi:sarcosine oxidase subunit beta